jgi:hypothetical protein
VQYREGSCTTLSLFAARSRQRLTVPIARSHQLSANSEVVSFEPPGARPWSEQSDCGMRTARHACIDRRELIDALSPVPSGQRPSFWRCAGRYTMPDRLSGAQRFP